MIRTFGRINKCLQLSGEHSLPTEFELGVLGQIRFAKSAHSLPSYALGEQWLEMLYIRRPLIR